MASRARPSCPLPNPSLLRIVEVRNAKQVNAVWGKALVVLSNVERVSTQLPLRDVAKQCALKQIAVLKTRLVMPLCARKASPLCPVILVNPKHALPTSVVRRTHPVEISVVPRVSSQLPKQFVRKLNAKPMSAAKKIHPVETLHAMMAFTGPTLELAVPQSVRRRSAVRQIRSVETKTSSVRLDSMRLMMLLMLFVVRRIVNKKSAAVRIPHVNFMNAQLAFIQVPPRCAKEKNVQRVNVARKIQPVQTTNAQTTTSQVPKTPVPARPAQPWSAAKRPQRQQQRSLCIATVTSVLQASRKTCAGMHVMTRNAPATSAVIRLYPRQPQQQPRKYLLHRRHHQPLVALSLAQLGREICVDEVGTKC